MPPISLDSSLATHPGSKGEEARDVSEIGRAGPGEEPRTAERPAEAVERAAKGRGRDRGCCGAKTSPTAPTEPSWTPSTVQTTGMTSSLSIPSWCGRSSA